ncbi:carboxyltransferase domain-containing protein [Devosia rhodophyticola]|uniref:Carboxyltransferase domain-containing protein n=1 Tax=Devosia rhodophyticola TaxID=3026423 RepID=A0ABY7YX84_9HYPH|nr:carboxyltransferase domain-containing protein [Devosia rhodophyticola]WDR05837.1 carboxyltransferase domain-containing protein [Devosia rhodophyticola]
MADKIQELRPKIVPLGDRALLVRFATSLSAEANAAAIGFAQNLADAPPQGALEIVPSLVSVQINYDPTQISGSQLSAELSLRYWGMKAEPSGPARTWKMPTRFGGAAGPDLEAVANSLELTVNQFILAHNAAELRILATGFAPGFVYAGFHEANLQVPRRAKVRDHVSPGSILFAVGQTAIAATPIPTGWHVIGQTDFRNFDPSMQPPTKLRAGDRLIFEAVS